MNSTITFHAQSSNGDCYSEQNICVEKNWADIEYPVSSEREYKTSLQTKIQAAKKKNFSYRCENRIILGRELRNRA